MMLDYFNSQTLVGLQLQIDYQTKFYANQIQT